MVFRSLCCCTAATTEAVVVHPKHAETLSTTRREERRPSVSSSSAASSIGLAYLDAVEDDVTENGSKRGSMGDLFFDAEEALESENFDFQVKYEKDQSVNGQSLHDEALLAPNLRDGGHRRARIEALDKGFPGSLTEHQLKAYQKFRSELQRRDQIYRDMVYAFSHVEPEAYALCRFLRFCNFHVEKTFHYMDRHTSKWEEAAKCDFYPDSQKAVGAPMSVLLTQFPSLYFGNARAGYPVCYFRAENLSEEGIECITNLDRLPNVIWFSVMNHLRHKMYPKAQEIDPSFVRYVSILCLPHVLLSSVL